MNKIKSEEPAKYEAKANTPTDREDEIIRKALSILEARMAKPSDTLFLCPATIKDYLKLRLLEYPYEVFSVLFLNNRHALIGYQEMFRGTIDGASVHPREVVRAAINCNAAAVIFAHNHPSGYAQPSQADFKITNRLKDALALIDVRVLDHIIVGTDEPYSMAEAGTL